MGEYNFKGEINKKKIFIINHSEITERIDPVYFKTVNDLLIVKDTSNPVFKLSEVVNMKRGRFGHRPRNDPKFYNGKYPFIQTGDVVKASKKGGQIPYTQTLNELGLKTSRLFEEKAIIITIAANIGDTAILDYPACFPDSLIAMTPKEEDKLQLEYLNVYFKFLKNYLNDLAPQAAQKNINYQQLAPTPIVIPPITIQQKIVDKYQKVYTQKQQKEQEAKEILESIDSYLLNELGVEQIEIFSNKYGMFSLNKKKHKNISYYSNISSLTKRYDPYYHIPIYKKIADSIKESKYKTIEIKELSDNIKSGKAPKNYYKKGYHYLKVRNLQDLKFNWNTDKISINDSSPDYLLQKNDIIMVTMGAGSLGKVAIFNEDFECQYDPKITLFRINKKHNNYYILNFLRTDLFQKLLEKEIRGSTGMTMLNPNDIGQIKIPLPPIEKQNKIANHIYNLRAKAKQLQEEAKSDLELVKQEIEQLILGNK
ncbi:restriction endonuclease subunit S [Tenacibaculum dicentrarchi]|nr:restriction endonuclease subunit S [Tenacibaculum dicentrarchi]MCD8420839.1 restriction endonuclease subunit S [Tenacibaculum dicentrarchi]